MACYWGNYCSSYGYGACAPTITYYVQPTVHYQYVNATPCCYYQQPAASYVSPCAYAPVVTPQPVQATVCQVAAQRVAVPTRTVLPAANYSCYAQPAMPCAQERHFHYQEPTVVRNVELHFYDTQTVVRENNNHYTHNRTIVTNVNRNHWHTQRIVTNENNYNTYLTNNVIRVNDIHHQRIENVEGEKRVFNDYKQTETVEPAQCVVADSSCNESVSN